MTLNQQGGKMKDMWNSCVTVIAVFAALCTLYIPLLHGSDLGFARSLQPSGYDYYGQPQLKWRWGIMGIGPMGIVPFGRSYRLVEFKGGGTVWLGAVEAKFGRLGIGAKLLDGTTVPGGRHLISLLPLFARYYAFETGDESYGQDWFKAYLYSTGNRWLCLGGSTAAESASTRAGFIEGGIGMDYAIGRLGLFVWSLRLGYMNAAEYWSAPRRNRAWMGPVVRAEVSF